MGPCPAETHEFVRGRGLLPDDLGVDAITNGALVPQKSARVREALLDWRVTRSVSTCMGATHGIQQIERTGRFDED
jgi:hypothetical protein